jgi:hypothetical protein
LGTPSLSRLSNSFLAVTDSFRSKTPEIISNFVKPLLSPTTSDEQQQHEDTRKSSQYLLPSRKPSLQQIPEDQKPLVAGHEVSPYKNCSYTQGVMNGKDVQLLYYFWDSQRDKECIMHIMHSSVRSVRWFIQGNLSRDLTEECMRCQCPEIIVMVCEHDKYRVGPSIIDIWEYSRDMPLLNTNSTEPRRIPHRLNVQVQCTDLDLDSRHSYSL